jgi:hypothetical protein
MLIGMDFDTGKIFVNGHVRENYKPVTCNTTIEFLHDIKKGEIKFLVNKIPRITVS